MFLSPTLSLFPGFHPNSPDLSSAQVPLYSFCIRLNRCTPQSEFSPPNNKNESVLRWRTPSRSAKSETERRQVGIHSNKYLHSSSERLSGFSSELSQTQFIPPQPYPDRENSLNRFQRNPVTTLKFSLRLYQTIGSTRGHQPPLPYRQNDPG